MLPRGRGRPLGVVNPERREAQFRNYKPKRWHPEFDLMVIESVAGKSNEEIGRLFGYTKEHVSNILSTEEASKVKERIRETVNKEFDGKLKDRLAKIGERCVAKIETFVEDENNLAEKSPFMFIDRALKIAQSVNTLSNVDGVKNNINNTYVNGNALVVNNEQSNQLSNALAKSMSLDNIKPGDIIDVDVVNEDIKKLRAG